MFVNSHSCKGLLGVVALLMVSTSTLASTRPAASLLPDSTTGYISVPNVEGLLEAWKETDLGELTGDPRLQPFVQQILQKVRDNGNGLEARFGFTIGDLREVSGGELCLAVLEPTGHDTHATAIICNVEKHAAQTQALLQKIHSALRALKATHQVQNISGRKVTVHSVPGLLGPTSGHQVCVVVVQEQLVVTDHLEAMRLVLARWKDPSLPALSGRQNFQTVQQRTTLPDQVTVHVNWYVEPFGFARVLRSLGQRKRGTDLLKILQSQGFGALEAVGGQLALKTNKHELLHRTLVYCPQQRELAARMLDFPNVPQQAPADWIPKTSSNYVSFNWRMVDAFEYSESLINALAKGENFFDEFLENLENDPNGPRVNLRRDLIAHLGDRITFISDSPQPIHPKSERFLVAVDVTNTEAVAATVTQALQADPTAKAHDFNGLTIWEIVNGPAEDELEGLTVDVVVDGKKFGFGPGRAEEKHVEEAPPSLPNSAIAVVGGRLIVSSHVEYIVEVISGQQSPADSLGESGDYVRLATALADLGAGEESFRMFSRTDETFRATYELVRQGRVGESESLVARLLNRLNGDAPTAKHAQRIDGSKLPPFQYVQRYLGPAGATVQTQPDGWMITGCVLSQQ